MKAKLTYLCLAAFAFTSCDKGGESPGSDSTKPTKPRPENQTGAATLAERPTPVPTDPSGTTPAETSPETPMPEKMIEKFRSEGITGIPKDVVDAIIRKSEHAENAEEQLSIINDEAAAWRRIDGFKENEIVMPDHMKRSLLEKLSAKHGDAWAEMAFELDEQIAASTKLDELRANGIPGMTPDESQDLIIQALEKHGADYKAILALANQSAKK